MTSIKGKGGVCKRGYPLFEQQTATIYVVWKS